MEELERCARKRALTRKAFWARMAEELHWFKKWDTVLELASAARRVVCRRQDQHLLQLSRPASDNLAAQQSRAYLGRRARRSANTYLSTTSFRSLQIRQRPEAPGIEKGDRVALYMPLIPELAIAMLACARIGATHSVIFGGFSSAALIDRINDASCKLVVTADGGWRRGKEVKLKAAVDEALKANPIGQSRASSCGARASAFTCKPAATTGGTS